MARSFYYEHPNGPQQTIDALYEAISPHTAFLIEKNLAIYSTTDMKVGLDVCRLVDAEALLADLLRLDPRGGHFAQRQLAATLRRALEGKLAILEERTRSEQRPMDEVLELVAYKLRVMMSHVWNCYDGAKVDEKKTHQLKGLFGLLDGGHLVGASVRKQRREAWLGRRVHPFPFVRDGADDVELMG